MILWDMSPRECWHRIGSRHVFWSINRSFIPIHLVTFATTSCIYMYLEDRSSGIADVPTHPPPDTLQSDKEIGADARGNVKCGQGKRRRFRYSASPIRWGGAQGIVTHAYVIVTHQTTAYKCDVSIRSPMEAAAVAISQAHPSKYDGQEGVVADVSRASPFSTSVSKLIGHFVSDPLRGQNQIDVLTCRQSRPWRDLRAQRPCRRCASRTNPRLRKSDDTYRDRC